LGWTAVGIGVLILVVVIAVVVLLHTQAFHNYILGVAEQKASAALGTKAQASNFALHFSGISPTVDLYDVVIHGAEPYPNPALLQVPHVRIGVTITSLLHQSWYLNELVVDRPVVHVVVDQRGTDNLPKLSAQSHTNVFDLGVRHAKLERGEVYYNSRKTDINADLHDLDFQSAFDTAKQAYSGTVAYHDGQIKMAGYNPIPHNLQAQFTATPSTFTLKRAEVTSGSSRLVLSATLQNYSSPRVTGSYDALVDAGQFRRILNDPSLPAGVVRLNGTLAYRSNPNAPLLKTVSLNGDFSSPALLVKTAGFSGYVRDVAARYSLANGNAEVRDIRARLLGGDVTGTLIVRNLTGAQQSRLRAQAQGLSLAELKPLMSSPSMQQVSLAGTVNGDVDAAWGKTTANLVASTDATVQANVGPANASGGAANTVPVNGVIHARYSAPAKQITLAKSYIRMPQTTLTFDGTASNRSSLHVRMESNDLQELETIADTFRSNSSGQPVQALGLYGTASFAGSVTGSTNAPHVRGQLTAKDLKVKGTSWRLLRTNVDLSPSMASFQNGVLQPANRGRITFDAMAGLKQWSPTKTTPFQVTLNASQVNVADVAKVAGISTPVSGTLAANIAVRGSQTNPVGGGEIRLSKAEYIEQIRLARLTFQGTGNEVHANLNVATPVGNANGAFKFFPKQEEYQFQFQANGIQLAKLKLTQVRNLQLSGVMNVNASGQGTLHNPGLQATVQVPQLMVRNQAINGIVLNADVANHVAHLALASQVLNTQVSGRGTIDLSGDYETTATLDTPPIALQPILAIYAPDEAEDVSGQTELHATLRGPLKDKARLEAHVTIPTLQVNYNNLVQMGAVSPIHLDFANGVLALQKTQIRGTDTDLQLQGAFPMNSSAPISLLVLGTVNLKLAQLFVPDARTSGQLKFDINSYGQRSNPNIEGQVQIVNAGFASGSLPIGLQNGNGTLTLTKDRLNITQFHGTVGGGEVSAAGGILYRPGIRFDLALAGKSIRMLYPEGVREQFDAQLALTGTRESALMRGTVRIGQISFTPDFDLTNFIGQLGGETTPPPRGFAQNLKLDVSIQSTGGVHLVSRTLSLQANANLRATGTAAQPVLLGRVNVSGGDLIFSGNRFVLKGGTIDFANPARTEPVVNLAVGTTVDQYDIRMHFWGPLNHMQTTYSSDPSLPPSDIINLIAFGHTTESTTASTAVPGNAGAESLLASQVASQVTSRVEKIAGISQLSVNPILGSTPGEAPGARVTIRQRVTSNLFVTFSTDIASTQRQTIQVQYQLSPRMSISGTRDQNGGFGFDTLFRRTW
jgi:translocation and assembly module TamB